MKTGIKICGIRRSEDCAYINEALPDYAGFIFWPKSFRYIELEQAVKLKKEIDQRIRTVGVFVDETKERICEIVKSGAIDIVQLHGHEDEAFIAELRELLAEILPGSSIGLWKAFKIRSEVDIQKAILSNADMVLLDNGYGTGECFDHSLIHDLGRPYILAGGLTPENIPELKTKYDPAVLDISSGVETEKYKDREKILKAVRNARN